MTGPLVTRDGVSGPHVRWASGVGGRQDVRLRVRGGVGDIAADLDAVEATARALLRCAAALDEVLGHVAPLRSAPALLLTASLDPGGAASAELALAGAACSGREVVAEVHLLGLHLAGVVLAYRSADAVAATAWQGLRTAVWLAAAGVGVPQVPPGDVAAGRVPQPRGAGQALPSGAADVAAGLAAAAVGGPRATPAGVARWAVARPAVRDLVGSTATVVVSAPPVPGAPAVPGRPPTGIGQLLSRVSSLYPGGSRDPRRQPGRVRVERVARPGRAPVAVVYIPGTETWSTGGPVPMDGGTNLRALAGQRTAAGDAVTGALQLAGVGRDEPLLMVGHSQGGMTAVQLAGDPDFRARFTTAAVITAGSPIAGLRTPADVPVLSLEHPDGVRGADGARNPATLTHTTVEAPTPRGHGAHAASGYAVTGEDVDASDDPSLVAFEAVLSPFLDGGGATSTSTDYVARRAG